MNTNVNDEFILCQKCGEEFNPSEFDDIDDEFNDACPKCPACQEQARIKNKQCEYCDLPAQFEADGLYLCEKHHEDYLEHHPLSKD
jgi:hypothetical protein